MSFTSLRRFFLSAAPGTNPLAVESPAPGAYAGVKKFDDLPLSRYSREGLKHHKFKSMTAIQRATLPHTLCGRDLLGAAKTGSGKTLAFLLPVLEKLFRLRWSSVDGLGALIITPTRELAMQVLTAQRGVHAGASAAVRDALR